MIKVFANDPVQFEAAQKAIVVPCVGDSMRLVTGKDSDDGKRQLAIRFDTQVGTVCYLTSVDELSDALEKVAGSAVGARALDLDDDDN